MKRGLLWALIATGAVAVVAGTSVALLANRDVTTSLARYAIEKVDKQIPAEVHFSHLSVRPFSGMVAIDDLELTIPGKKAEKFAVAKQIIVTLDVASLATGHVRIRAIHLVKPEVTIIHRGDNQYNVMDMLPQASAEDTEKGGAAFAIDKVTVEGGRLTYIDKPRKIAAELPHLDANLELDVATVSAAGRVTLSSGWVKRDGFKHPIDSFRVDFDKDGPNVKIDEFKLDAGSTELAARGRVDGIDSDDPKLALDGLLKTDLAAYASLPELKSLGLAGRATADWQVQGSVKEPRAGVRLTAEGLRVRQISVPKLAARFAATKREVKIEEATALLWGGKIALAGTAPLDKTGKLDATAEVTDLDLGAAARDLELKGDVAKARGKVSARVAARGQGSDPEDWFAAGWLRADGSVPVKGRPLPLQARTDFRWERGALDMSKLDAHALGARLTGEGRVVPLAKVPTYAFRGAIANLDFQAAAKAVGEKSPVTGRASATIDVRGKSFEKPMLAGSGIVSAAGTLVAQAAGNKGPVPFTADATLKLDGRDLALERLAGKVFGGLIDATGRVPLDGNPDRITVTAQARGIDLAAVDRAFPIAEGPFSGRADARIRLDGKRFTLASSEIRTLGGEITASGKAALTKVPSYDLGINVKGLDLEAARKAFGFARVPFQGKAGATLRVAGAGNNFRAAGPIQVIGRAIVPDDKGAPTKRFLPVRVAGTVSVTPRMVDLTPMEIRMGSSVVTARGRVALDGASNLVFDGQVADAPVIARVFGLPPLQGGDAKLTGRASGPAGALRFDAKLALDRTEVAGIRLGGADLTIQGSYGRDLAVDGKLAAREIVTAAATVDSFDTPFSYRAPAKKPAAGTLSLLAIAARMGKGGLTGKASYAPAARRYTIDLRSSAMTVGLLQALDPEQVSAIPPGTTIDVEVKGAGTLDVPKADAKLDLGSFRHEDLVLGASTLRANVNGTRLKLDGKLFGDQAALTGSLPLGPGRGQIDLDLKDVRLAPVFALLPPSLKSQIEVPTGGLLAGKVQVAGPFTEPSALTADVDLKTLAIGFPDMSLVNRGPLKMHYGDRRLDFRSFRMEGGGTDIGIRGIFGVGVASSLNIDGQLNLAILEKVAPKQFANASGKATIDGQLRGRLGDPSMAGSLTIRDGEFESRNLPQPVRDLAATVRLSRDKVFLDEFKATLGYTGRIRAQGGATLDDGFQPVAVNMQVDAQEVAVRGPGYEVTANADLSFIGRPGGGRLDGQIRVLEGEYTEDVDLTGGIAARRNSGRGAQASGGSTFDHPLLRDLAMRVQVLIPDQFKIANNIATAEIRGDLVVLGRPSRPSIVGRVEALDGKITFQDRVYALEEATIDFTNPAKLTPYMHVVATSSIQAVDVRVQANGTPEKLKLDLTSTPAMPQTDVLALIATGQTPDQLRDGGGGGFATASNLLLNQVTGGVARGITDGGVVDVLNIKPGSTDPASPGGGSFTVGKRLNEKLTITYTQDIAAPPGRTPGRVMIFDYLLTEAVILKMEQDLSGGFNASARYRIPIR